MENKTEINQAIYQFTDFRQFMAFYYKGRKKARIGFSYRAFAKKAGFTSPSFIRLVITGEKNLTKNSVVKLCRAMGLDEQASNYFENLVFFSQSKNFDDKKYYLDKIDHFHKKNTPAILAREELDYLKEWYHPVIRELAELLNAGETPDSISRKLLFPLTPAQVKASLDLLITAGFLDRGPEGKLSKKDKTLSTGKIEKNELLAVTARAYHKKMAKLSMDSISLLAGDQRKTTDTTLSLSEKSFMIAQERVNALRFELLELAASEQKSGRVFQLHLNLFPLTGNLNEKAE